MKILILGLPKSGTTALFFKLKPILPATGWCLFEPRRFEPPSWPELDVLAKILIGDPDDFDYPSFDAFQKRILIVRDPRDHLVSRLLYRACADPDFRRDDTKVKAFAEAIREKETTPRSVSILDLIDRYNWLRDEGRVLPTTGIPRSWAIGCYPRALAFHHNDERLYLYTYEEFVTGNYRGIEQYLGCALPQGDALVPEQYDHVRRTKRSGDWRHWFTEEDVNFFRPHLLPYMRAYGYADEWKLAEQPHIAPEHASGFVLRSVGHRRRELETLPPHGHSSSRRRSFPSAATG